jgi:undecaprenyl-diphosphatase
VTTSRLRGDRPDVGDARPAPDHALANSVGAVALVVLAVLTVLVATGLTHGLDDRVRELFRPGDQWGDLQVRVDTIVEGLRPPITATLLLLATVVAVVLRRSWWPAVFVAVTMGSAVALTGALQLTVGRADTHGDLGPLGGSFPSGHVVTVMVAAGCAALLARESPGWLAWTLVGLAGGIMGWALLVQTAHWSTDVVSGLLLGTAVLAVAVRLPFTRGRGSAPAADD